MKSIEVIQGNETWHASLDRRIEQSRLRFHDHVAQPRERRYATHAAPDTHPPLGSVAQVDTGNRHAEFLESLQFVGGGAGAHKRFYAGSPFAQSSGDASLTVTNRLPGRGDTLTDDADKLVKVGTANASVNVPGVEGAAVSGRGARRQARALRRWTQTGWQIHRQARRGGVQPQAQRNTLADTIVGQVLVIDVGGNDLPVGQSLLRSEISEGEDVEARFEIERVLVRSARGP